MNNDKIKLLIKACEGFSQSNLIEIIWGKENINSSYRSMISKRLNGQGSFTILEVEKLKTFFKQKINVIELFLKNE